MVGLLCDQLKAPLVGRSLFDNPSRPDCDWPPMNCYAHSSREEQSEGCLHVGVDAANLLASGELEQYSMITPAMPKYGVTEHLSWSPCQVNRAP